MASRTAYSTWTPQKPTLFDGHYLRNRSTLDIGVLGYIGIVQHKEHPPEVFSIPPGTPCIRICVCVCIWHRITENCVLGRMFVKLLLFTWVHLKRMKVPSTPCLINITYACTGSVMKIKARVEFEIRESRSAVGSGFTQGLFSWKTPGKSNTQFPFKAVYFLGVKGLRTSTYVVYDGTTKGPVEYISTVYVTFYAVYISIKYIINNNNNNNNTVHRSFRNIGCLWVLSTSISC